MSYHTEEEKSAIRNASAVELIRADNYYGARRNTAILLGIVLGGLIVLAGWHLLLLFFPVCIFFWAMKEHFWVSLIRQEAKKRIAKFTDARESAGS